ncbi:18170_t:CDS:2 [Entrophospora sp. SA101]|nr:18170_t:CDS:2 [Entrophospora sp. SA101]
MSLNTNLVCSGISIVKLVKSDSKEQILNDPPFGKFDVQSVWKEKDMTFTLAVCEIVHPKISDSDNTLRNSYEKY